MSIVASFAGFSPETFQYLNDLKENNFKQWFDDHREIYEIELLQPFRALVSTLSPAMYTIDPLFELRPHRVLSRIYRDIRFSKNKDPYKTSIWMSFQRIGTTWDQFPGFFMELTPDHCMTGMGLYAPKRKVMDTFREMIEINPNNFRDMVEKSVLNRGYDIEGENYKKPIPNNLPPFFQPWLNRKNLYLKKIIPLTDQRIYSEELAHLLIDDFSHLEKLYQLMVEAKIESE